MVLAVVALVLSQSQFKVPELSSYELLKGQDVTPRVLQVARNHRWLTFGKWDGSEMDTLRKSARMIAQWRADDKALDSVAAGSETQKTLLSNWKHPLLRAGANPIEANLRELILQLKPRQFPVEKPPGGRWLKIDGNGANGLDRQTNELALKLRALVAKKYEDPDVRCYLLLRRIAGRLIAYLSCIGFDGKHLGLEKIDLANATGTDADAKIAHMIFPAKTIRTMKPAEIGGEKSTDAITAKKLDLDGIERQGFVNWFQSKVFAGKLDHPVAVLASDLDLLTFLAKGGCFEEFLNGRGYRAVTVDGVEIVIPEVFDEAETCRLNELELSHIDPEADSGTIIRKYAQWVAESGLMANFDNLHYVENALCWQRRLPNLSEEIFPLLPVLRDLPKFEASLNLNLAGTERGSFGDNLLHDRLADPFGLGPVVPAELSMGYAWGEGAYQHLRDVNIRLSSDQRVRFPDLAGIAMDADRLASNLGFFGSTWGQIETKAGPRPVELLSGDTVTITFTTNHGRLNTATLFFTRKTLQAGPFKDLPKDVMDEIKAKTIEVLTEMNKAEPPPPPMRAVQ